MAAKKSSWPRIQTNTSYVTWISPSGPTKVNDFGSTAAVWSKCQRTHQDLQPIMTVVTWWGRLPHDPSPTKMAVLEACFKVASKMRWTLWLKCQAKQRFKSSEFRANAQPGLQNSQVNDLGVMAAAQSTCQMKTQCFRTFSLHQDMGPIMTVIMQWCQLMVIPMSLHQCIPDCTSAAQMLETSALFSGMLCFQPPPQWTMCAQSPASTEFHVMKLILALVYFPWHRYCLLC